MTAATEPLLPFTLDREAVERAIRLDDLVDDLRAGYATTGRAESWRRNTISGTDPGHQFSVASSVSEAAGLYVSTVDTRVPGPAGTAVMVVMSTRTGQPEAVLDGVAVRESRCAAITALGTDLGTPKRPVRLGIALDGALSLQQFRGVVTVRPVTALTVYAGRPELAEAFVDEVRVRLVPGTPIRVVGDPAELVDEHDVVCATPATSAALTARKPGAGRLHLNCASEYPDGPGFEAQGLRADQVLISTAEPVADGLDLSAALAVGRAGLLDRSTVFSYPGDPYADLITVAHILRNVPAWVARRGG